MPALIEPNAEQLAEWEAWVADRPDDIRAVCERLNPWTLYRLKTTGQYVTVLSYQEADPENEEATYHKVTLSVNVDARWNWAAFPGRNVFGVDPDDLEECEEFPEEMNLGPIIFQVEEEG